MTHPSTLAQDGVFLLESLPSSKKGSIIKHIVTVRIQGPVASLARLLVVPGHLDEALVQGQVMANGILPALSIYPIIRKLVHYKIINLKIEGGHQ